MIEIAIIFGAVILFIGAIGFIIAAFRTSILWGFAVLLFYPASLFYLFFHWEDAKVPFKLQVFGIIILFVAAYMDM